MLLADLQCWYTVVIIIVLVLFVPVHGSNCTIIETKLIYLLHKTANWRFIWKFRINSQAPDIWWLPQGTIIRRSQKYVGHPGDTYLLFSFFCYLIA